MTASTPATFSLFFNDKSPSWLNNICLHNVKPIPLPCGFVV
nr:hypothetical protein [Colwellia sp. BRX10-4]